MRLKPISFILLAGLMGYFGYWYFLSLNTDIYLEKVAERLAQQGAVFEYASYEVSGFPYRLVLTFENPVIRFQNGPLEILVEGTTMDVIAQPWNLSHIIFFPENPEIRLSYAAQEITLKPEHLGFSIYDLGAGGYRLSSEFTGVEISSFPETGTLVKLDTMAFHLRKEIQEIQEAEGLFEPKLLELALSGTRGKELSFEVTSSFRGQEVPELTQSALEVWRNQGGTFEIDKLQISQLGRTFEGAGSFSLDNRFRPLGVFSIEGVSPKEILSFFTANSWIEEKDAVLVGSFIATLPKDANGNDLILPLAFSIQEGFLTLGTARLKEIGSIIPE